MATPQLEELLEYTLSVLKESADKKFYKKNIYPEFVKQIICRCNIPKSGKYFNNFIVKDRSKTFQTLREIPYIEQRTPEWFKIKEESIGASESVAIFVKVLLVMKKLLYSKNVDTDHRHHNR